MDIAAIGLDEYSNAATLTGGCFVFIVVSNDDEGVQVCIVDIRVLIQALARPWFIEQTQAHHWAGIVNEMFFQRRADAVPNNDNRKDPWGDMRFEFPRLDANLNISPDGPVQLIKLQGPLMKYNFCGALGMEALQQGLRAAYADSTVLSIVAINDSPGGTVDGTHNLAREFGKRNKPIVSFVNGMMCSANYWIGSSADEIIVDDANNGYNATIGSIGTMAMWKDKSKAEETAGIKTHIVTATKSTLKTARFEQANAGDYKQLIQDLDNLNETFLAAVQTNRQGKLKIDAAGVLEGETFDGKAAIKLGLVDRMGGLDVAVKRSLQLAKTIR